MDTLDKPFYNTPTILFTKMNSECGAALIRRSWKHKKRNLNSVECSVLLKIELISKFNAQKKTRDNAAQETLPHL